MSRTFLLPQQNDIQICGIGRSIKAAMAPDRDLNTLSFLWNAAFHLFDGGQKYEDPITVKHATPKP